MQKSVLEDDIKKFIEANEVIEKMNLRKLNQYPIFRELFISYKGMLHSGLKKFIGKVSLSRSIEENVSMMEALEKVKESKNELGAIYRQQALLGLLEEFEAQVKHVGFSRQSGNIGGVGDGDSMLLESQFNFVSSFLEVYKFNRDDAISEKVLENYFTNYFKFFTKFVEIKNTFVSDIDMQANKMSSSMKRSNNIEDIQDEALMGENQKSKFEEEFIGFFGKIILESFDLIINYVKGCKDLKIYKIIQKNLVKIHHFI